MSGTPTSTLGSKTTRHCALGFQEWKQSVQWRQDHARRAIKVTHDGRHQGHARRAPSRSRTTGAIEVT
ncbi:MAG: hypothetical protein L0G94_17160, partial [Brachybacterium sp.]|uniref:hypothetical protein n=1 Tax=Brachybacterium sp. TaxID=1891286 RepID=UPI0026493025